jgi:hypothetical protein
MFALNGLNKTIAKMADGIDTDTVIPANNPKYAFAPLNK